MLNRFFVSMVMITGVCLVSLSACTKKSSSGDWAAKVVNLAIWSNYVSPELIKDFEKKTGIKVQVANYSSNEELLAKLQAGASGYDVAVPSDYMIFAMIKLGLIRELDRTQLSNFKALDAKFLNKSFDPGNKFSVPYDWGTTGIAVNRTLYKGEIKGWKNLFTNPDLAGKFSLLDDVRETIGAAMKQLGFSLNSRNPDELQKAKELLLKNRGRVKSFTSEPMMPLTNGETAVAHAYLSDALQARRATGGKIEYIIPEEGCTLWIDNLVIPTGAQHLAEAHAFIDFLLEAKSNVSTVMSVLVAPANKEAFALLSKDLQTNPVLFPSEKALAKCEMIQDLGDTLTLWDRAWTEVKAQ
ncbi:spermidine/putrescine ABC transporter substrate-binding protein [Bdellovibrionota bacterium FG-1]